MRREINIMETELLETQLNAVRGFVSWLSDQPQEQDEHDQEFDQHVIQVFSVYEMELERQIEGTPALQVWFDMVAINSMLAIIMKDELTSDHPELAEYRPADEPTTINEMTLRLLSDALELFTAAQTEMAGYLVVPEFHGTLHGFITNVLESFTPPTHEGSLNAI
jgi:hypothetical protein